MENREWEQNYEVDSKDRACVLAQHGSLRHRESWHFNDLVGDGDGQSQEATGLSFLPVRLLFMGDGVAKGHWLLGRFLQPCSGQNGTCKRTGERHTVLAGIDPVSKCFRAHIVEAYPRALSTSLAKMLHEGRMQLDHLDHSHRLMF